MAGILLIDDADEDLKRAREILSQAGYRINGIAKDGESGLQTYFEDLRGAGNN